MNSKLKLAAVGAAALLATGAISSEARADAIGFSSFQISDAQIFNDATDDPLTPAVFSTLNVTNSTNASANLGNAGTSLQDPTDVPLQVLGTVAISENDFTRQFDTIGPNFSRGDALLEDTLFTGASANAVAEGYVTGDITASSTGQTGNFTIFDFALTEAIDIRFTFNAAVDLYSQLLGDPGVGQSASSSVSFQVVIRNSETGELIFRWRPDGIAGNIVGGVENADAYSLNNDVTALLTPTTLTEVDSGFFSATITDLEVDTLYNLTIEQIATVELTSVAVPEPETVGMLGASLIAVAGVGAARRRKHNKA